LFYLLLLLVISARDFFVCIVLHKLHKALLRSLCAAAQARPWLTLDWSALWPHFRQRNRVEDICHAYVRIPLPQVRREF